MSAFRAAVFDMDGLLIDTERIWRRAMIDAFGSVGLHLTEKDCLETMGMRLKEMVDYYYQLHPWDTEVAHGTAPAAVPSREDVGQMILASVIRHVNEAGEPMPGALAAVRTAHELGLSIAIASGSSQPLIDAVVARLGLAGHVQLTCSADEEEMGKPHPAVYLRAAARLDVDPEVCLALEDAPSGVASAKAAGMFCIAVPDKQLIDDPRYDVADLRLASLEELTPEMLGCIVARSE